MFVGSFVVGTLGEVLHPGLLIGFICLVGISAIGLCGLRLLCTVRDAFRFVRAGIWSTTVRNISINRTSTSRRNAPVYGVIGNQRSDNLPCASDKGTFAGSLSGQQGINFGDFDRVELANM